VTNERGGTPGTCALPGGYGKIGCIPKPNVFNHSSRPVRDELRVAQRETLE
jgi:hypothetical protein